MTPDHTWGLGGFLSYSLVRLGLTHEIPDPSAQLSRALAGRGLEWRPATSSRAMNKEFRGATIPNDTDFEGA
jgi:hypothetical protein